MKFAGGSVKVKGFDGADIIRFNSMSNAEGGIGSLNINIEARKTTLLIRRNLRHRFNVCQHSRGSLMDTEQPP